MAHLRKMTRRGRDPPCSGEQRRGEGLAQTLSQKDRRLRVSSALNETQGCGASDEKVGWKVEGETLHVNLLAAVGPGAGERLWGPSAATVRQVDDTCASGSTPRRAEDPTPEAQTAPHLA